MINSVSILKEGFRSHHPNPEEVEKLDLHKIPSKQLIKLINQMTFDTSNPNQSTTNFMFKSKTRFAEVKEKGLINKIINLLLRLSPNSIYRFWLASCVESFLRGINPTHQTLVAHTGLLEEFLSDIVNGKTTKSNNKQISFDLLGEMIKFNKHNIIMLEKLCIERKWETSFCDAAGKNVVDSNVFLRGLLLSFERFDYLASKEVIIATIFNSRINFL